MASGRAGRVAQALPDQAPRKLISVRLPHTSDLIHILQILALESAALNDPSFRQADCS